MKRINDSFLISVVTIVYNDVDEIENTIKSVLSQTYPYIEYIIIDGGSTDGTVQTIKLYEEKIAYWHSKKDDGIYDAMNKANKLANGDYIFFLNSGDIFSTNNILEKIFSNLEKEYKLLAGRTNISYKNKNLDIVSPPPNIFLTKKSKTFSHQATFIHKSIYKNFDYDLHYKISADKEYWYKIKNIDDFNVKFYDLVIAGFELGGVSNNHKNVLNRRIEDLYIEYQYDKVTLKKFLKYFAITIISYLITINEDFYFNKIYPMLNNIKNKMVKK